MEKPQFVQKIKQKLLNIVKAIATPVVAEITVFGMMLLLNLVGAVYYNLHYSATATNALIWTAALSPIYVLIAYLATLVVYGCGKLNRYLRGVVCWAILGLYTLCTVVEVCLLTFFDTYFSPTIATFLFQTTSAETNGFLEAYVYTKDFVWCISIIAVIVAVILCVVRCIKRWFIRCSIYGVVVLFSILASVVYVGYGSLRMKVMEKFPYTAFSRTISSLIRYSHILAEQGNINDETLVEGVVDSSAPSVVLIIGESYNKYHCELYGYNKEVNPNLSKYKQDDRDDKLCVFEDVIVPYNSTHRMLQEILSLHSVDCDKEWNKYPLLPHIMRDAGYYVSFISNQVPAYGDDGCAGNLGAYFFQYPQVAKRSFDYRNTEIYNYDLSLLEELKSSRLNRNGRPEFSIIQLKGQHLYSKYNFPAAYAKFESKDYNEHSFVLSESQKQEIADYDNATLYNDYVVEQIFRCYDDTPTIIIYMSDHGEEVHDYRPFLSRSHGRVKTQNEIKYQYQIPFLIYANQKMVEQNSDLVCRMVDAQTLPFMADDVSHIILGLSGVKSGWYNPRRDLFHDEYNAQRVRSIEDEHVYRKIE